MIIIIRSLYGSVNGRSMNRYYGASKSSTIWLPNRKNTNRMCHTYVTCSSGESTYSPSVKLFVSCCYGSSRVSRPFLLRFHYWYVDFTHITTLSSWPYLFSQNNPSPNSSNFVGQKPTRTRVVLLFKYADYK
jgi:hypothetical protein